MLPFLWNVFNSNRYGETVTVDDPWGYGNSLEWATTCPPALARISSDRADELSPAAIRTPVRQAASAPGRWDHA